MSRVVLWWAPRRTSMKMSAVRKSLGMICQNAYSFNGLVNHTHLRWPVADRIRHEENEKETWPLAAYVICASGFVLNCTAGIAWGLLVTWARDGLHLDGSRRNAASGCYDLVKVV